MLHLLAPNHRAVQVTTDLAGFWRRHYPAIAKELRRKYPRHPFPDDPLSASSWRKEPLPVFAKNVAAKAFGVGHPSFVRSPDGREDWIVYHATDRPGAGWRGRSVRAQPFRWTGDDRPDFGRPVAIGQPLRAPSGTPGNSVAAP